MPGTSSASHVAGLLSHLSGTADSLGAPLRVKEIWVVDGVGTEKA